MKKLTTDSKARFFAQYWGQEIAKYPSEISIFKWKVDGFMFNNIKKITLELTPLQNITDEHAIGVAKILRPNDEHLHTADEGKRYIKKLFSGVTYLVSVSIHLYQYLQSKSYALDWYCPIENRIIPVQEQIDNGWITFKEN